MRTKLKQLILISCCLLVSCSNTNKKKSDPHSESAQQEVITEFPHPDIPLMYVEPQQRAEYLIKHYWDNINFTDTLINYSEEMIEQAWVDYIDLNNQFIFDGQEESLTKLAENINTAQEEMQSSFMSLINKYLYNHNSPVRNESIYITMGRELLKNPKLDIATKERLIYRIELAVKNRVGEKAIDFHYTRNDGAKSTLYNTKAENLLIFFNQPDCQACAIAREELNSSSIVNQMLDDGSLKIIVLYSGTDFDLWMNHSNDFPDKWIKAYNEDLEISDKNLYDLQVTPSFYLLDANKRVVFKDGNLEQITHYLIQLN